MKMRLSIPAWLSAAAIVIFCAGCESKPPPVTQAQSARTSPAIPSGHANSDKKKNKALVRGRKLDDDEIRLRLLTAEAVQKDLGLTRDQVAKINSAVKLGREMSDEFQAKLRPIVPSVSYTKEDAARTDEKLRGVEDEFRTKCVLERTKLLGALALTPAQIKRLDQIHLQTAVLAAMSQADIIKTLEFTKVQTEDIRAIGNRATQADHAIFPKLHGLNHDSRRNKILEYERAREKIDAEATRQILDLLTTAQRAKFDQICGKKIVVAYADDLLVPSDAALDVMPYGHLTTGTKEWRRALAA